MAEPSTPVDAQLLRANDVDQSKPTISAGQSSTVDDRDPDCASDSNNDETHVVFSLLDPASLSGTRRLEETDAGSGLNSLPSESRTLAIDGVETTGGVCGENGTEVEGESSPDVGHRLLSDVNRVDDVDVVIESVVTPDETANRSTESCEAETCCSSDLGSLSSDELRQLADIIFPMLNNIKSSLQDVPLESMSVTTDASALTGKKDDTGVMTTDRYLRNDDDTLHKDCENDTEKIIDENIDDSHRVPVRLESQPSNVGEVLTTPIIGDVLTTPCGVLDVEVEQQQPAANNASTVSIHSPSSATIDSSLPASTLYEHQLEMSTSEVVDVTLHDVGIVDAALQYSSQQHRTGDENANVGGQLPQVPPPVVDGSTSTSGDVILSSSGPSMPVNPDGVDAAFTDASSKPDEVKQTVDTVDFSGDIHVESPSSVVASIGSSICTEGVKAHEAGTTSTGVDDVENSPACQRNALEVEEEEEEEDKCLSKYQRIAVLMKLQKEMGVMQLEMSKLRDAIRSSDALLQQLIDSEFHDT